MPTLNLVITDAGRAAIVNAQNTGTLPVVINQVALGTGRWLPDTTAIELDTELKRITAVGGQAVADDTIHITVTDDSTDEYSLGEFGLYTDGGVLFAIYSSTSGITAKAADALLLLAADCILTSVTPGSVTVGATGFSNPQATETLAGVAKVATQAMADAGADDSTMVTPLKAKATAYTIDQALAVTANTGTITQLLSWLASMVKAITGKSDWKTAPATSLEAASTHMISSGAVHGATSAATANQLIVRDEFGRAQVAAPSAASDIARKQDVDVKQDAITGGASSITTANLTAARALVSDANGKVAASAVTSTEIGYVDGVTSNIQTQINGKQATVTGGASTITASNLTASRALVSDASGKVAVSAVTSTQLGYVSGVTSAIQTQLNGKLATTGKAADSSLLNGVAETTAATANTIVKRDAGGSGIFYVMRAYQAACESTLSTPSLIGKNLSATFTSQNLYLLTTRAATAAYSFIDAYSGNGADLEFSLYGDGNGKCDGAWTGGGADYAEYFEWADGNLAAEDRRGISVVLSGGQICPATVSDVPSTIIGVISGNPSVVGDAAWNKWSEKYVRDDFGSYILEDYEAWEWEEYVTDEAGAPAVKLHSYAFDEVPADVVVPANKTVVVQQRRILNPAYDPTAEYVPREQRPEWDAVGLMGKLRLRKGQPVGDRWVKMRDVSPDVEEWLVR